MSNRLLRINDEILKESANIIRMELNDPRIGVMTSVVRVETTNDLKYSKIFVSVFGNDEQKKEVLEGLKNASGYIRKLLAKRVNLRNTPQLKFILDDTLDYSDKISRLINEVSSNDNLSDEDEN